jgi:hypothetical protein
VHEFLFLESTTANKLVHIVYHLQAMPQRSLEATLRLGKPRRQPSPHRRWYSARVCCAMARQL